MANSTAHESKPLPWAPRSPTPSGALTDESVRQEQPGKVRRIVWDADVPAFGVRVTPTGKKSFVLYMRAAGAGRGGEQKWITLGRFPEMSVAQARKGALRLRAERQSAALAIKESLLAEDAHFAISMARVDGQERPAAAEIIADLMAAGDAINEESMMDDGVSEETSERWVAAYLAASSWLAETGK